MLARDPPNPSRLLLHLSAGSSLAPLGYVGAPTPWPLAGSAKIKADSLGSSVPWKSEPKLRYQVELVHVVQEVREVLLGVNCGLPSCLLPRRSPR